MVCLCVYVRHTYKREFVHAVVQGREGCSKGCVRVVVCVCIM